MGTIIVLKYEVILLTTQNNVSCVAIIKTVPRVKLSDHLQKLYFYTNFKWYASPAAPVTEVLSKKKVTDFVEHKHLPVCALLLLMCDRVRAHLHVSPAHGCVSEQLCGVCTLQLYPSRYSRSLRWWTVPRHPLVSSPSPLNGFLCYRAQWRIDTMTVNAYVTHP